MGGLPLLGWPAASFGLLGVAYLFGTPRPLGKSPETGRVALLSRAVLLPYYCVLWFTWWLQSKLGDEPWHRIHEHLYLGRRVDASELPADATLCIDLTSEFSEDPRIVEQYEYRCIPTLDMLAPHMTSTLDLLDALRGRQDVIYVHCASGQGRSATVAAALLGMRDHAHSPEAAVSTLRNLRRGVSLSKDQWRLLRQLYDKLALQ